MSSIWWQHERNRIILVRRIYSCLFYLVTVVGTACFLGMAAVSFLPAVMYLSDNTGHYNHNTKHAEKVYT